MLEALKSELATVQAVVKKKNKIPTLFDTLDSCSKHLKERDANPSLGRFIDNLAFNHNEFFNACSLLSDYKKTDYSNMGVSLLLKVLHLHPIQESKDLKTLI